MTKQAYRGSDRSDNGAHFLSRVLGGLLCGWALAACGGNEASPPDDLRSIHGDTEDENNAAATDSGDAGNGTVGPAALPIADLVQSLIPGPTEIHCNVENECPVGSCMLDTNPCAGDLMVTTEAELEALRGCTSIAGDLVIRAPQLANLEALSSLVAIGGNFSIQNSNALSNLSGLDNLVSVSLALSIDGNASLANLHGLEKLHFVGDTIRIDSNESLVTLEGLELAEHDGVLSLRGDKLLSNLQALSTLTCLGGLSITNADGMTALTGLEGLEQLGSLQLASNPSLSNLDALKQLRWIPGTLQIDRLDSLGDLSGLSGLVGVKDLWVYENANLTSFAGLDSLAVVTGELISLLGTLEGLNALRAVGGPLHGNMLDLQGLDSIEAIFALNLSGDVDLHGLPTGTLIGTLGLQFNSLAQDLTALGDITIIDGVMLSANRALRSLDGVQHTGRFAVVALEANDVLTSLDALSGLHTIEDQLFITNNPALGDFEGLDEIESVGNRFYVHGNAPFDSAAATGFESLTAIAGDFVIQDEFDLDLVPQLRSVGTLALGSTSYVDLTAFSQFSVQGGLRLEDNETLASLDGLVHAERFETDITLTSNPRLFNLQSLRGLQSIGGRVWIAGNAALTNLEGLNDLGSIGSNLSLRSNSGLRNLGGLENLTSIAANIAIESNPLLEDLNGLARLTSVDTLRDGSYPTNTILDNANLPQCAAEELLARLALGDRATVSGNDEAGTCD